MYNLTRAQSQESTCHSIENHPLILYGDIPLEMENRETSDEFTFSKIYKFVTSKGHLFIEIEKDIQRLIQKKRGRAAVITDLKAEFRDYISPVSLNGKIIF